MRAPTAVSALVLAVIPAAAHGGANDGAHAYLSWSNGNGEAVTDAAPDATGRMTAYLSVTGAPDVARLSFEILWSADLTRGGRLVWPHRPAAEDACGVTDADPSRWGNVTFRRPPVGDFCVAMPLEVRPAAAPAAARFRLAYLRLEDSHGAVDEIAVEGGGLTLNGGGDAGTSFAVTPTTALRLVAAGRPDTVTVSGYGFDGMLRAVLRAGPTEVPARILSRSWTELRLEIDPRFDHAGTWRLHIEGTTGLAFADSSLSVDVLPAVGGRVWEVPTDFPKVRLALEAASPGDTVRVLPGVYERDHAWILNQDGVVLVGSGADRTVLRAEGDAVLGIVDSEGVHVSGIRFEVDNRDAGHRVPVITSDAACTIEQCVFVVKDCRMCGLVIAPKALRFTNNTVVKRGVGSDLFVRVAPESRGPTNCVVERNVSSGFNASLECHECVPPEGSCNWDPGALRRWVSTVSTMEPEFEDADSGDFRLRPGSPGLPENNACGVLMGALPGGQP